MRVVGSVSNEEEEKELEYIAKIHLVGMRIRELSQKARSKNENNNTKKNK